MTEAKDIYFYKTSAEIKKETGGNDPARNSRLFCVVGLRETFETLMQFKKKSEWILTQSLIN